MAFVRENDFGQLSNIARIRRVDAVNCRNVKALPWVCFGDIGPPRFCEIF